MKKGRWRRQIAIEAAKLLAEGREADYTQAKRRAARILGVRFTTEDFPSTREIRDAVRQIEDLAEPGPIDCDLRRMHLDALRLMRVLRAFDPRLTLPLAQEEVRTGLETTITGVGRPAALADELANEGLDAFPAESATSAGAGRSVYLVAGDHPTKVILYAAEATRDGWTIERLEDHLRLEGVDLDAEVAGIGPSGDRFIALEDLLLPLEEIRVDPVTHPEGDALHHALQLFDLAMAEHPYDEELLTAALFHDVGRLVRSGDLVRDARALLDRLVTRRTLDLIEDLLILSEEYPPTQRHRSADAVRDAERLAELDRQARRVGVETTSPEEAINYLRQLDAQSLWDEDGRGS